jgi:hypothetical protein
MGVSDQLEVSSLLQEVWHLLFFDVQDLLGAI